MASPYGFRNWLVMGVGLCGGIAVGAFLPGTGGGARNGNAKERVETRDSAATAAASGAAPLENPGTNGPVSAGSAESLADMAPDRIITLFEKVSNLRSESRKYILAYRLASKLGLDQIEPALRSALQDLNDGDYVTTRALARRWVELDPGTAAAKSIQMKQQHLLVPVLEAWTRMDPAGPLDWALQQDDATKADAVRPLLMGRLLDQAQLEKLVKYAGGSASEEMSKQVFPFAAARLSEANPAGALHAAAAVEEPEMRQRTLMMVLSRLGGSSPDVAKAWLASQTNLTPEERQQYESAIANPRGGLGRSSR